jgi:hypothetical protein
MSWLPSTSKRFMRAEQSCGPERSLLDAVLAAVAAVQLYEPDKFTVGTGPSHPTLTHTGFGGKRGSCNLGSGLEWVAASDTIAAPEARPAASARDVRAMAGAAT